MKTCPKCKNTKPIAEFWVNTTNKDGLQSYCIPCLKQANSENQRSLHSRALDILGGKCVECGFNDYRALQIDHIDGGGSQAHKKTNNRKTYRNIANGEISGFQVLCANCNWIKRHENGEHGNYFTGRSVV